MDPWKNWIRCSLLRVFCCYYSFLLTVSSPLPLKQTGTLNNNSCSLSQHHFQRITIKNLTYSVAKQARLYDKDTDNRFVGQHLYTNITRNERCYLMKRITDTVLTHVLYNLKNQYPSLQEVIYFLVHLNAELRDCKPLEDKTYIEGHLKRMKDKLEELGENGMNKVVGELDLLFDYLENACTSKKASSGHRGNKN
ncbi:interleukin-22 [Protobothrops mucrosquamatus]|uniref:interleukin-22 n=1 Tax=Protobothrops mucrosquamatus TaxID=103944 RepID=UPI000775D125|nr:interleukin-22 [Protobothrops mucrosquamatus]